MSTRTTRPEQSQGLGHPEGEPTAWNPKHNEESKPVWRSPWAMGSATLAVVVAAVAAGYGAGSANNNDPTDDGRIVAEGGAQPGDEAPGFEFEKGDNPVESPGVSEAEVERQKLAEEWGPIEMRVNDLNFPEGYQDIADNIQLNPYEQVDEDSIPEYLDNLGVVLPGTTAQAIQEYEKWSFGGEANWNTPGYHAKRLYDTLLADGQMHYNMSAYANIEFLNPELSEADINKLQQGMFERIGYVKIESHEDSAVLEALDKATDDAIAWTEDHDLDRHDYLLAANFSGYNPQTNTYSIRIRLAEASTGKTEQNIEYDMAEVDTQYPFTLSPGAAESFHNQERVSDEGRRSNPDAQWVLPIL